jgi:predicted Holliday junction resolvase-like endonuclease
MPVFDYLSLIAGIIIGIVVAYLLIGTIKDRAIVHHRRDAVRKSRSVLSGQMQEQIAPILPDFPYHPKDLVFIGKGFDYLVLDGLHSGNLREVIFLEIKTGSSQQNKNEKAIQAAIDRKKVYYELMRL